MPHLVMSASDGFYVGAAGGRRKIHVRALTLSPGSVSALTAGWTTVATFRQGGDRRWCDPPKPVSRRPSSCSVC